MTPQQLKNSLLQMAIEGKLTEQRADDGTAADLLKKIQAEKAKLIKEGKIKKEKPLPPVSDDEIPFDIPSNWKWVRLGEIGETNIGLTYKPTDISIEGVIVLRSSNIQDGCMDYGDVVKVQCEISDKAMINKGDLLICARNGSRSLVGKVAMVDKDGMAFGAFMAKYCSSFNNYVMCFLQSPVFRGQLDGVKTETINQITQTMLKNQLIPLPPLAEQKRIVVKLDELLPLVDAYAKAYTELQELNKAFPGKLKNSLLQMAIEGKLTEQRADDGTAADLLKEIQAEKAKLIKEGKIKKEKPLPEITAEEMPFDIPENWCWVRLRNIVYNRQQLIPKEKFSYIDIGSIDNEKQRLNDEEKIIEAQNAPSRARKIVDYGDILYSTVRPYLHNMCIVDKEFSYQPIASTGFAALVCYTGVLNKFLFYYMLGPEFDSYANAVDNAKGVAYPAINDDKLYKALIPLPPLAEQKRIVAKLDKLLPLCDQLTT